MEAQSNTGPDVNWVMACFLGAIIVLCPFGCWLTSINLHHIGVTITVLCVLAGIFGPIPVYWHQKQRKDRRDAILIIFWSLLLWTLMPVPFLIGARLHFPLRDNFFALFDQSLGVNVGALVGWASVHEAGYLINKSYALLFPYLAIAIILPSLLGRPESKRFLLANCIALAIGLPCFVLFPAIGPWYAEHFPVGHPQLAVEAQLLALRGPGTYSYSILGDSAGIVSFPSFHVVWSVLAASGLWGFRSLRIPLVAFSSVIIISTMTTGWHYFSDVLAGLILVSVALLAERTISARFREGNQTVESASDIVTEQIQA